MKKHIVKCILAATIVSALVMTQAVADDPPYPDHDSDKDQFALRLPVRLANLPHGNG